MKLVDGHKKLGRISLIMAEKKTPKRKPASSRKKIIFEDNSLSEKNLTENKNQNYFDPNSTKNKLRYYFLITLIFGSLLILFPFFSGIVQIILASLLMGFIGFLKKLCKFTCYKSCFADSIYYLGFLFTFVALIASMVFEDENFNIELIIGQM